MRYLESFTLKIIKRTSLNLEADSSLICESRAGSVSFNGKDYMTFGICLIYIHKHKLFALMVMYTTHKPNGLRTCSVNKIKIQLVYFKSLRSNYEFYGIEKRIPFLSGIPLLCFLLFSFEEAYRQ